MRLIAFLKKYNTWIIFVVLLLLHFFLQAHNFEKYNPFSWDQVDNAWAAKNIIDNHQMPLVGMVAKQNSGFNIGPGYYYFLVPFYLLTRLDPSASGIVAIVTSIATFFIIFIVTKKLFNTKVALFCLFWDVVSSSSILFDRVQWPVALLPAISLLGFYFLYKITQGDRWSWVWLGLTVGASFQIHFTAIYFFPIILLTLPFFPWRLKNISFILLGVCCFALFLLPNIINLIESHAQQATNFIQYAHSYFQGFHLKRFLYISPDIFLELGSLLSIKTIEILKLFIIPVWIFVFLWKNISRKTLTLVYLVILWFLIPSIVLATYKGEISDYYYAFNRYVALFLIGYILYWLFSFKNILTRSILLVTLLVFAINNIFWAQNSYPDYTLYKYRIRVAKEIKKHKIIPFQEGVADAYLAYVYKRNGLLKK